MDRKSERIEAWVDQTWRARETSRASNSLQAHFDNVDPSVARSNPNPAPTATRSAFRRPPVLPQTDFRPVRQGILIDLRTSSEIDRDEADTRGHATSRPSSTGPRSASQPRKSNPNRRRIPTTNKDRRREPIHDCCNMMADAKLQQPSPHPPLHLAQGQYVPPHLRKSNQNAVASREDGVSLKEPAKPQNLPPHMRNHTMQGQYVPPHMRKASQHGAANRSGDVSAGSDTPIDNGAICNESSTYNGGVSLGAWENGQSKTPSTTAPSSTVATAPCHALEQTSEAVQTQASQTHADPTHAAPMHNTPPQSNPPQPSAPQVSTPQPSPPQAVQSHTDPNTAWHQTLPHTGSHARVDSHFREQGGNYIKPKRNNKWITNKEIRERAKNDCGEPSGTWGSQGSDDGFNSNPGADPQHDIKKLVDWEGNWLPGPTDWESRRSYHHRNFNEEMMRFVDGSIDKEAAVDVYDEPSFLSEPNGEVAPRIWASLRIEGTTLQEWWSNHVGSALAESDSKAWWRSYRSMESSLLDPYEVPVAKIDPTDHEGQILHMQDLGSQDASEKLIERKNKKKAEKEKRIAREREHNAATAAELQNMTFALPEKIKPRISLYIRPALAADAHQIAGIYNHYIHHSIKSAEILPLSVPELARRIADETSSHMPWLVACQKGRKAGRGYTNGTDASILGFACASDYLSRQSMYAFTAEAEVFVHPNYHRHKIGSCLMDRLLYILDPFYYVKDGYQFIGTGPFAEHGGSRVIGSVVMNVPFDKKDADDLKGITKFLAKFDFKKEAELTNIGVKKEMHVSLATFRYHTGCTINPKCAVFS